MGNEHRKQARRAKEEADESLLNAVAVGAAVTAAATGAAPVMVALMGLVLQGALPSFTKKRIERLERAFEHVGGRLDLLQEKAQEHEELLTTVGQQLLFGRCSGNRIEQLARLIKTGIESEGLAAERTVDIMRLLGELTDEQVLLLCAGTRRYSDDDAWVAKHGRSLGQGVQTLRGDLNVDLAFAQQGEVVLKAKGLIEDQRIVRTNEFGRMFLREIGLLGANEI